MPGMHKYGESNTTEIMMACHFRSGMYEISGRLIFVEQSVQGKKCSGSITDGEFIECR
jgi:hypothetical protein